MEERTGRDGEFGSRPEDSTLTLYSSNCFFRLNAKCSAFCISSLKKIFFHAGKPQKI
jgi:hypothetical protein